MADLNESPIEEAAETDVARLLAEAPPQAVSRLTNIARAPGSKSVVKAARRALYLLSQRGINAPGGGSAVPAAARPEAEDSLRCWTSAYDGAGNRLFLFILSAAEGGDATVAQVLANDELGVRDLTLERKRLREVLPLLERLEQRIDDGLVVAEIEPDYGRHLLERFRAINFRRVKTTPAGFVDLLPRIGAPRAEHTESPVYAHLQLGPVPGDEPPPDPDALFQMPWFEPWFFAVEDIQPWLDQWISAAAGSTKDGAEEAQSYQRAIIAREAANALLSGSLRDLYVARLEESADVLRRRGRIAEAGQALYHAQMLKSDTPAGEVPFAAALAARTLQAGAEMTSAAAPEAGEPGD